MTDSHQARPARSRPILLSLALILALLLLPSGTANHLDVTSVAPADLKAGATSTVTIEFTTHQALNTSDNINITFPSGYDVSGATNAICASISGTVAITNITGQTFTIDRQGDGDDEAGGSAASCTVDDIVNPTVSGTTGDYTIRTYNATSNTVMDEDTTVTGSTITPNDLTGVTIEQNTTIAGATAQVHVNFTTTNDIPTGGFLNVTFPGTYDVTGATGATCSSEDGGDTTFATSIDGQTVRIEFQGAGEPAAAETCTIDGIVNPGVPAAGANFEVRTTDTSDAVIDEDATVTGPAITASSLSGVTLALNTTLQDETSRVFVNFTTSNEIPTNGYLNVTFPAGWNVTGAASGACSSLDDGATITTSTPGGQHVRLHFSASESAGTENCTIDGIVNPSSTGSGTFYINTTDNAETVIDASGAITGPTITAPPSSGGSGGGGDVYNGPSAEVEGHRDDITATLTPGTMGTWEFDYVLGADILGRTYLQIEYPEGFTLETENSSECEIKKPADLEVEAISYPSATTIQCDLGIIGKLESGTIFTASLTEVTNAEAGDYDVILSLLDYNERAEQIVTYAVTIEAVDDGPTADADTTADDDQDTEGQDTSTGDTGGDGGTGADNTEGKDEDDTDVDKDTPGVSLLAIALPLLVAAAVWRRKD